MQNHETEKWEKNISTDCSSLIIEQNTESYDEMLTTSKQVKSNAVVVDKAFKTYGNGKHKIQALENLSMLVPHGSIYGLLGPSGCGKTTLLGCLVGRLHLDNGKIYLFGFAPRTRESAVPGGRVGYMPQDLALYKEFTIMETLQYIGRLNHMQTLTIEDRSKFLVTFLNLPDRRRLIDELSGGQQRRVSLAAALIHEPELLILDEPTVGVDPLLRTNIWNHLVDVSKAGDTTIIITTHYIEEARQADRVGLMRNGKLLEESSPQALLEHYGFTSLETLFLKLCLHDGNLEKQNIESSSEIKDVNPSSKLIQEENSSEMFLVKPWVSLKNEKSFSVGRCYALIIKNIIRMKRNIPFLLFSFILPFIQTVLFCVTVGGTPHDLKVAVVNLDSPPLFFPEISSYYLNHLDSDTIEQVSYSTFDEGYSSVVDGKNWGLIFMNTTFSLGFYTQNDNKDGTIHVYMDNTNEVVSLTIKIALYRALELSTLDYLSSHPIDRISNFTIPLKMETPVYATDEFSFRNFVAPGILITTIYFMAAGLTSLAFIIEKKEGLLERSWVSGVRVSEVLLSYLITQMFIMAVQITIVMVCLFPIFNIPCEGNMVWVVLLTVLQGICGMCYGLMVSVISKDELTAIQLLLGTFYPLLLISGIVWPLEGMPDVIRYIAYAFPQTYACEGMRAILYRGWNIAHFEVYIAYVITIGWGIIHFTVSVLLFKI